MSDVAPDLARLAELNANRTPGPWSGDADENDGNVLWDMTPEDFQFTVAMANAASVLLRDAGRTQQLEAALAFYADEKNWTQPTSWGGRIMDDESAALNDCGKKAREALAGEGATE